MGFRTRRSRATIDRRIQISEVSSTSAQSPLARRLGPLSIQRSQFACQVTHLWRGQQAHSIRYWALMLTGWCSLRVLVSAPSLPLDPPAVEKFDARGAET